MEGDRRPTGKIFQEFPPLKFLINKSFSHVLNIIVISMKIFLRLRCRRVPREKMFENWRFFFLIFDEILHVMASPVIRITNM